jgi:hypothetical protein
VSAEFKNGLESSEVSWVAVDSDIIAVENGQALSTSEPSAIAVAHNNVVSRLQARLEKVTTFQIAKTISISWRGEGAWAVCDMGLVLNHDGDWEYEPTPSNRTEEFKARTRYSLDEAFIKAELEAKSQA